MFTGCVCNLNLFGEKRFPKHRNRFARKISQNRNYIFQKKKNIYPEYSIARHSKDLSTKQRRLLKRCDKFRHSRPKKNSEMKKIFLDFLSISWVFVHIRPNCVKRSLDAQWKTTSLISLSLLIGFRNTNGTIK